MHLVFGFISELGWNHISIWYLYLLEEEKEDDELSFVFVDAIFCICFIVCQATAAGATSV